MYSLKNESLLIMSYVDILAIIPIKVKRDIFSIKKFYLIYEEIYIYSSCETDVTTFLDI